MSTKDLRNFAIIAHIDHGKSTLADRLMEKAGLLPPAKTRTPRIDRMELEIERGVTIKLKAVRLPYTVDSNHYILNMIDTPGHVDFSYEVSRSLAACEGALLLVDSTSGVQAQTLSHLEEAQDLGLEVIGAINKIDSPIARVQEAEEEMRELGIEGEILKISALTGEGVDAVIRAVVERIPFPQEEQGKPFRALVFDSSFDAHLGAISYIRVMDGYLIQVEERALEVEFLKANIKASVKELGYFAPDRKSGSELLVGEVGYIATGLKDPSAIKVGDTVFLPGSSVSALAGYKEPQSFVFASFFAQNVEFPEFKKALQTLRLEEPAVSAEEIASVAFGRGFKLGFLGTFHLEIVRERLTREFDLDLVVTKPTVDFTSLKEEPWINLSILVPSKYLSAIIKIVTGKRGFIGKTLTLGNRLKVSAELPLIEFVRGFYDSLKSVSSGYASFSWEFSGYKPADLVELEILVHGESVEGLQETVTRQEAQRVGREKLKKLKKVLSRQQFSYAIQAKVRGKIIAREDVPAFRKNVTGGLYGGDVTRKRKLLEKQKKGKKRLARFGRVEIPPQAFLV